MTHAEFLAARDRLGLTAERLAAELNLAPAVTAAWEAGTLAVPERHAREIEWRAAAREREDALAASGLPECGWVARWHDEPFPDGMRAQGAHFERLEQHATGCPVCTARERFVVERFPPMPPRPVHGLVGVLAAVTGRVERLPEWARPPAYGALAFATLTAFRLLFGYAAWSGGPDAWLVAAQALLAGAAIGAALGLVYGGWRRLRRGRPAVQP